MNPGSGIELVKLKHCWLLATLLASIIGYSPASFSQPVPAADGTGTTVTPNGDSLRDSSASRFNISGGKTSRDGANLFHSFSRFGLSSGQIANFLSNPNIRNIFGRVTGGSASYINGLIQVTGGNSNLFLMNPAGIVFGAGASLNVPGAFTATTANAIGFDAGWFSAVAPNDYASLVGTPSAFTFNTSVPGSLLNFGNLAVTEGQNLTLLGGTVISTGTLSAPGGNITVAAVPGENTVRISQQGHLLSLEIQNPQSLLSPNPPIPAPITSLPQLLAGGDFDHASGVRVNGDGTVQLIGSGIRVENGDVVVANAALRGESITLSGDRNLVLAQSQLRSRGDLTLFARDTVRVRDSAAVPFEAIAGGNLRIQGNNSIDILALNSGAAFQAAGNLTLTSNGTISGDARFAAGGNFSILNLSGAPGNFISLYDPIVSSEGDVTFGNYTGAALKIEAKGSIIGGDIIITGPDTALSGTDPDIAILTSSPALILRAGVTELRNPPNVPASVSGSEFTSPGAPSFPASIRVGNISTSSSNRLLNVSGGLTVDLLASTGNGGTVILEATGDISTGGINSTAAAGNGGNISITSIGGNISTSELNASLSEIIPSNPNESSNIAGSGGNITLQAAGNITTGNINSSSRAGNGGNIAIASTSGAIATGSLDSSAFSLFGNFSSNTSQTGSGGYIALQAAGDIKAAQINSSSGAGNGGNISLSSTSGTVTANSVNASSRDASSGGGVVITSPRGAVAFGTVGSVTNAETSSSGNGGSVTISAAGDIRLDRVDSSAINGNGSNISLTSLKGNITTTELFSFSDFGTQAGAVKLKAAGNITTSEIDSLALQGTPGKVELSAGGKVNIVTSNSPSIITALGDVTFGDYRGVSLKVETAGSIFGGNIFITGQNTSLSGTDPDIPILASRPALILRSGLTELANSPNLPPQISSGGAIFSASSTAGSGSITVGNISTSSFKTSGGPVILSARGDIVTGAIDATSFAGDGGDISLTSTAGSIAVNYVINSAQGLQEARGGNIIFTAAGNITTNGLSTSSYRGNSGDISLTSTGGSVTGTFLTSTFSASDSGNAGAIAVLAAGDITTSSIDASSFGGNGGNISLTSTGGAIKPGRLFSASRGSLPGSGGAIALLSAGDISTAEIHASSVGGNGGKISLTSTAGNITGGNIYSVSELGSQGGSVILNAAGNLSAGIIDTIGRMPGEVLLNAGGGVTVTEINGPSIVSADGDVTFGNYEGRSLKIEATGSIEGGDITITRANPSLSGTDPDISILANRSSLILRAGLTELENSQNLLPQISSAGTRFSSSGTAGAGSIKVGNIAAASSGSQGGAVILSARGDIVSGRIYSGSSTGDGGYISLTSTSGSISTNNLISENSNFADGLNSAITLEAAGNITTGAIDAISYRTNGGNISLTSTGGAIKTDAINAASQAASLGSGGSVTLNAAGDITTASIQSIAEAGNGGNITLTSTAGSIRTANLSSFTDLGSQGGAVILQAGGDIATGAIDAAGTQAGELQFIAGGNVTTGSLNSLSIISADGDVTFGNYEGRSLKVEATGSIVGGDITITRRNPNLSGSDPDIPILASRPALILRSGLTDLANSPNLVSEIAARGTTFTLSGASSDGSVKVGDITISSERSGGLVIVSARGDITAGQINAFSNAGNGSEISLSSTGGSITTSQISSLSLAASGEEGSITLQAEGNIATGDITSSSFEGNGGTIFLSSNRGSITANSLYSSAFSGRGGSVTLNAAGDISTGAIAASSEEGNAGNISVRSASGNITAGAIDAAARRTSGGSAGSVILEAAGNITSPEINASSQTGNGGNISVTSTGGRITVPLVNSSSTTGQAGQVVVSARDNVGTRLINASSQQGESGNVSLSSSEGNVIASRVESSGANGGGEVILKGANAIATLGDALKQGQLEEATSQIEELREGEMARYFGQNFSGASVTAKSIRETLGAIASQTGTQSAIVYAIALPEQLELVLFPPEGQPIRRSVPAARQEALLAAAKDFRSQITDPRYRNTDNYRQSAEQLYQWLIAPIEADLQQKGIDTLLFSLDAGLRGIPLAALHDGKQFLVEKYSLALVPSISLTDTRYQSLKDSRVLAMGASEFTDQAPLPAVPAELSEIAEKIWPGKAFLNQDFTPENLQKQRREQPYQIIHLATHGEFLPGDASKSYIQFWNTKLPLDRLSQLQLNNPPVELLVLSACRTALGDEQAELGFAGLAISAGVKSAIASLWYVSDIATLGLMAEFYQNLKAAPIKAEALRQAQLTMLRGQVYLAENQLRTSNRGISLPDEFSALEKQAFSHPYYWAGFTTIGSPW